MRAIGYDRDFAAIATEEARAPAGCGDGRRQVARDPTRSPGADGPGSQRTSSSTSGRRPRRSPPTAPPRRVHAGDRRRGAGQPGRRSLDRRAGAQRRLAGPGRPTITRPRAPTGGQTVRVIGGWPGDLEHDRAPLGHEPTALRHHIVDPATRRLRGRGLADGERGRGARASTPTSRARRRSSAARRRPAGSAALGLPSRLVAPGRTSGPRRRVAGGGRRVSLLVASAPSAYWYATRGAGLVALLLLTASVVMGVVDLSRWQSERWPRFVVDGLHRTVSLLAVAVVAIHVSDDGRRRLHPDRPQGRGDPVRLAVPAALAGARHAGLRPAARGDPDQHPAPQARPAGLARGALDRLRMLAAGARPRARHRDRHAGPLDAPADRGVPASRAGRRRLARRRGLARRPAAGARSRAPSVRPRLLALVLWVAAGPLGPNWAARAGTPAALLASVGAGSARRPPTRRGATLAPIPFSARLAGARPPARCAGVRARRGGHSHLAPRGRARGARDPDRGAAAGRRRRRDAGEPRHARPAERAVALPRPAGPASGHRLAASVVRRQRRVRLERGTSPSTRRRSE